jgi:putative sugar O-methyltransferase
MNYNYFYKKLINTNYQEQDHWDIFDKKYHDYIKDIDVMKNFRRNGISNMLETGLPSEKRDDYLFKNEYDIEYSEEEKEELEKRKEELLIMSEDEKLIFLEEVGSPRKHNNLNFDDLYHIYSCWQIKRFVNLLNKNLKIVTEIGGGYGNLANRIKKEFKNTKYVIIDLPEVLLIQYYYLINCNKNYKIVVFEEGIEVGDFDFLLVPFNKLNKLDLKPDLVISNRALGEMPKEVLNNYLKWIQNNLIIDGLFYTINRYVFTKSIDKNKIRDYNFDDNWNIILSQPTWLQSHLHEFILKRNDKENKLLKFILKSFPLSTPPPGPIMDNIQTQRQWLFNQTKDKIKE